MKQLPKTFGIYSSIQNKANPLWNKYIKWLQTEHNMSWQGRDHNSYYGPIEGKSANVGYKYTFGDVVLTLEEWNECMNNQFPTKWFIILTRENFEIVHKWYKETYDKYPINIGMAVGNVPYDGTYADCSNDGGNLKKYGGIEITFEQFQQHILKQKQVMKQQTITRKQLISLHNSDSCTTWKNYIMELIVANPLAIDETKITIPQKYLDLVINEGTTKQKQAIEELGISLQKEFNIIDLCDSGTNRPQTSIIELRKNSNLRDKSFYLSIKYNWEIVIDVEGIQCLIPTEK